MENKKPALIIIFNHKFDENIDKLYKIYNQKFSVIRFLVPFYEGDDENVIPVYESSYQFQGYISQAWCKLKEISCSHFVFIGDDLILNPSINELNIMELLNMNEQDAYCCEMIPLKNVKFWQFNRFVETNLALKTRGVNWKSELPSIDEAERKFASYGFKDYRMKGYVSTKEDEQGINKIIKKTIKFLYYEIYEHMDIDYPLLTAYSDFFVVPKNKCEQLFKYFGVFAAMRIFVEIAIPTSLMLAFDKNNLKSINDSKLKTLAMWEPSDFVESFEKKCEYRIDNMMDYWPMEYAYLHPVKLSKWN